MTEPPTTPPPSSSPVPGGSGLSHNIAGALSYLLGAITGIIFLLIDKERPFVRFHAMQSIVLFVAWIAAWIVLGIIGFLLGFIPVLGILVDLLLSVALGLGGFILWLFLMWQAYQGNEWEIPVLGEQARNFNRQVTPPGTD